MKFPYPKTCKSEFARRAFRHGFKDAAEACADSGEFSKPDGDWSNWALAGIGFTAFRKELGAKTAREFRRACIWYDAGGAAGVDAAAHAIGEAEGVRDAA